MRAASQCLWAVRSDTPRRAPISAKEKPPKNFKSTTSASCASTAARSSMRAADTKQLFVVGHFRLGLGRERDDLEPAAAFEGMPAARVIDDEAAHHLRGIGHEASAVRKDRCLASGDVEVDLVEERRRPDRGARSVVSELPLRQAVQLVVERGEERVRRRAVALLGGQDER